MIVISKPGKTEELKGRLEILLQGTDAKISLYDFDAQGIEMEIRKHDSQSDSSSTFDSEIKRLWDERLSAGLLKNDPNDFQHQRVGNFWIRISPPRDHIPLDQTPVDDGEKFDFTKVDSRTRLMDATFGNHTVSLIANNDPILPYHFLAVPELLQKREQKIEEMDIDLILQLISKSRDPHLKFTFNSKGAGASVDHIHFKGFYYHESQLPIEEAKTNFLSIKDGVRISMLDGFPAKGFVFEYEGIENSDKVAHVSGELIRHLQEESIPFNILVTHHKLFILPRSNQGVIVNHHNYIFGSVEMSGEIRASLEESFTSDQIAQFIGSATIGQKLFDQAKTFFDQAQLTRNGGIDLTADKVFSVQNNGHAIKFHIDPAMLQQLQNAPGFTPVIINIQPMTDLRLFLGLDSNNNLPAARSS